MASTNKTTNYELSQFVETDRPAWLTDYNSDMRKIDSNLKEVSDIAGGASSSISALADRMSTAEGNITTNTNDIAALDARADALEAGAQSQAGTIAGIQTEQTAQNLGIEAATELGYNLARPYDSASTYAVGSYVLFQNTLYKCVTAVSTGEAFDPTKWLAIKATDEIAAGGYTLPIASASQLGGVKVGNNLSIDPVTGVLSASDIEIIHLNSENFPLVAADAPSLLNDSAWYFKIENFYTNYATPTRQYFSDKNLRLSGNRNFYAKVGDLRILNLSILTGCVIPSGGSNVKYVATVGIKRPDIISDFPGDEHPEFLTPIDYSESVSFSGRGYVSLKVTNTKLVINVEGYSATTLPQTIISCYNMTLISRVTA